MLTSHPVYNATKVAKEVLPKSALGEADYTLDLWTKNCGVVSITPK